MNKLELEDRIIKRADMENIEIVKCNIYRKGKNRINILPTVVNNYKDEWISKFQIESLIDEVVPFDIEYEIPSIDLEGRYSIFKVGDIVEVDNIWIRLDADEECSDMVVGAGCGQWRKGWMKGKVFELNDGMVGVKFNRDVWIEKPDIGWINDVSELKRLIAKGDIYKVEKGQPVYIGIQSWNLRKIRNNR